MTLKLVGKAFRGQQYGLTKNFVVAGYLDRDIDPTDDPELSHLEWMTPWQARRLADKLRTLADQADKL